MSRGGGELTPCVLIAADSEDATERVARARGFAPELVLTRSDCAGRLKRARQEAREKHIDHVVIHSADWSRQPMQRLYEVGALRIPVSQRLVIQSTGPTLVLGHTQMMTRVALLPAEALAGLAASAAEARPARRRLPHVAAHPSSSRSVLVIWRGDPSVRTGGSVTHAAGMLGAFRALGVRVGFVTSCPPPEQIAASIDDLEVAAPLAASRRLTKELEDLCLNTVLRQAARRLLARMEPGFVYQRYDAFMTAGLWTAETAGVPLVLEWNGSAAWIRDKWQAGHAVKRAFDPLLVAIERDVLQGSTLIRSVSRHAADMAVSMGASPSRVKAIPNGVDIGSIPAASWNGSTSDAPRRLGWIGSFGPWHGAQVVVEALALLPSEISAVMIGEGLERAGCQKLAESLGVANRIEWTGELPHSEAVERLRECDVLLSPHVTTDDQPFFGSPTKLFEYMAIGRPIVASALEQIAELLDDGVTAKLVPSGDPAGLAAGVRAVLAAPDCGHSLGVAARIEAETRHTWVARAREVIDLLQLEPSAQTVER